MAVKKIDEKPTIGDQIVFDLLTPVPTTAVDDCFLSDPYKVDKVTIYYAERNFVSGPSIEVEQDFNNESLVAQLESATQDACEDPSDANLAKVARLKEQVEESSNSTTTYFNSAIPVLVVGNEDDPAWITTDEANSRLIHVTEDDDGNTIYGNFQLEWTPVGQRAGDYFICWTWTPLPSGEQRSAHIHFSLKGNTQLTTAIPSHFTQPEKYSTLLELYLPEMYKMRLCQGDLTPEVLDQFNESVADGFTFLEDHANQMQDVIDANATPEAFLLLLSNLFNLKLKSSDPTLWRRQIKTAIPLYKKKGTYESLQQAFDQAGMKLTKLTRLWQIISSYTWQEAVEVETEGQTEFILDGCGLAVLPIDPANFELYHRPAGSDIWTELDAFVSDGSPYVTLSNMTGATVMTWISTELALGVGDWLRIVYKVNEVPGISEQLIEDEIRALPIADQRDERLQDYPPKNWNVRLIEEDDPMFDVVIPTRHPFVEPLMYGWIRTEFPYSENIYNMEEYNGSLRESCDPCHLDKSFLDPCTACQSSKFNIDIEIEGLTNQRFVEALEVIDEYTPFHSRLHQINFAGAITELIPSPIETLTILIRFKITEPILSGNGHIIFNRVMKEAFQATRGTDLADQAEVADASGTGFNTNVVLFAPGTLNQTAETPTPTIASWKLSDQRINLDSNQLEVLAPSGHAGTYAITSVNGQHAVVTGVTETASGLDEEPFTFRIYNEIITDLTSDIAQDNKFLFSDDNVDFSSLGVKTDFDVENNDYAAPWTITLTSHTLGTHTIANVLPNGTIILNDDIPALPSSSATGISYQLRDDSGTLIASSSTGALTVENRGRVTVTLSGLDDIRNFVEIGHFAQIDSSPFPEPLPQVTEFVDESNFYIDNYTDGSQAGVSIVVVHLVTEEIGQFLYTGMELETAVDYESSLDVQNGSNPPAVPLENDSFMENFLVEVDPLGTSTYYKITSWDGTRLILAGPHGDWRTDATAGTSIDFKIHQFTKKSIAIPEKDEPYVPGHDYVGSPDTVSDFIDRRGNEVVDIDIETMTTMLSLNLESQSDDQVNEILETKEAVSYKIEYKTGEVEEGEL